MTGPDPRPVGTTGGTPQVLLAHHLKQLKLPTVLREYDKVARECARDGVSCDNEYWVLPHFPCWSGLYSGAGSGRHLDSRPWCSTCPLPCSPSFLARFW